MAEAGAKLAHAPVVCTDIMSAVTRVPLMRELGITVGLGCDTIINDVLKLMRIAFTMHNQAAMPLFDPFGFTTLDAFEMGTIDAAKLLLWDDEIGSLELHAPRSCSSRARSMVGIRRCCRTGLHER